jgi:hypothetical protein
VNQKLSNASSNMGRLTLLKNRPAIRKTSDVKNNHSNSDSNSSSSSTSESENFLSVSQLSYGSEQLPSTPTLQALRLAEQDKQSSLLKEKKILDKESKKRKKDKTEQKFNLESLTGQALKFVRQGVTNITCSQNLHSRVNDLPVVSPPETDPSKRVELFNRIITDSFKLYLVEQLNSTMNHSHGNTRLFTVSEISAIFRMLLER